MSDHDVDEIRLLLEQDTAVALGIADEIADELIAGKVPLDQTIQLAVAYRKTRTRISSLRGALKMAVAG